MLHTRKSMKGRRVTSPRQSLLPTLSKFLLGSDSFSQPVLSSGNYIHNVTSIFVPRAWASPCTIWLTKAGPFSEPIVTGSPYLGTISSKIFLATTVAVSPLVGKASTHPEKVSTRTNR